MTRFRLALLPLLSLPLAAQAWDLRLEVPFPKGQNLPLTLIQGTTQSIQGGLDTGKGYIASVNHRIIRVGPILRLDWGMEFAKMNTDGKVQKGAETFQSKLDQMGFGVGVNANFSVPFTGIAGEMGLIHRFQNYQFEANGVKNDKNLSRTWLRVGARWNLPIPLPVVSPYVAASYQQPVSKDKPVQVNNVADLGNYLSAQGNGQEFDRMWTFGVGLTF